MTSRRLKMRELERLTGVGRETIRFYIREGLLPEPERPGRNVAWYDESFVDRIRLVKELQEKRYLPLAVIKTIVSRADRPSPAEIDALLALDGRLFPAIEGAGATPERLSAVAQRTGIAATEIRTLADAGLIQLDTQGGDQWLAPDASRMVELWAELRAAGFVDALGFGPESMRVYANVVEMLARQELRIFTKGVTGRVDADRAAHMAEQGIAVVNHMLALLRRATLLRLVAEGNVPADDDAAAAQRVAQDPSGR